MDSEFLCITMNNSPKNRVTQEEIDELLNSANTEEATLFGKTLVVAYEFPQLGGWTIRGEGSVVDPSKFDLELGRKYAREEVNDKLWEFMGFVRQLELAGLITWKSQSTMNNNDISYLASQAYESYCYTTGSKNYLGNPMPVWDELPSASKTAWRAAVTKVMELVTQPK